MPTKKLLCLANSRKLSGRCVAGKEFGPMGPGPWVRPVSARPSEEVSIYERQYENGSDPRVLDIIKVPLIEPRPKTFQSENWLLDPDQYWVRDGRLTSQELPEICDDPDTLWQNGYSTNHGLNDDVPEEIADTFHTSLYLLPAR